MTDVMGIVPNIVDLRERVEALEREVAELRAQQQTPPEEPPTAVVTEVVQ